MARFLLVLKPRSPLDTTALIAGLDPMLDELEAEVDHRTAAHLSAMLSGCSWSPRCSPSWRVGFWRWF